MKRRLVAVAFLVCVNDVSKEKPFGGAHSYIIIAVYQEFEPYFPFRPATSIEISQQQVSIFCCVYAAASLLTTLCARDSNDHHIVAGGGDWPHTMRDEPLSPELN